jgi:formylglycine-generating enzyme required for sulfatase activity
MHAEKAEWRRYKTILHPGGSLEYTLHVNEYRGAWQNGLKLMFQDRWLYDLESFNDSLYHRPDLKWIRHEYIIGLQFAWNKAFYDWQTQQYTLAEFLEQGERLFGGYDVVGLWPTWPRLGVDQRNQWDLFADMPGGLEQIRKISRDMKARGTRFFICYNPWDESTRSENPYQGMARLISDTDADGVVLDCHGASSFLLQHAADSIKPGVVMYSEGMAVVKDMPGIVSGRVHDAIYLPPPLNLNKLIRPDFAIFRVCQLRDGRIRREASVAFFNGYGTELNTFAPGSAANMEDDLIYLGRTTRILRENTANFLSQEWTPLIDTRRDSIWVNQWPLGDKTIYTVFSLIPEGYNGPLFEGIPDDSMHLVSLWHHENLELAVVEGKHMIPARTEAFNRSDLGTRAEGNVDCIARFPRVIRARFNGPELEIEAGEGEIIRIWAGNPSYQNRSYLELPIGKHAVSIFNPPFNNHEGKYVIQLFEKEELLDETVVYLDPGTPRLVSQTIITAPTDRKPKGMVLIKSGSFEFKAENTDQFIPYPDVKEPVTTRIEAFYLDQFPVTNLQFRGFLESSGYLPSDPVNFLKHWENGGIPEGLENHPVVYVSFQDAQAYADWAGKRLPTEKEWQYAAQGSENRVWPWGNEYDSTRCNHALGQTTPVDAFPKGKSPHGVMDMTGNVWQITGDVYDNGTYYFVIIKGGSHYKPTSSWWYVKGGPQPNTWHQQLLLVSPSFDRNATVGFRCASDL